jgi:hypothetical protein
MDSRSKIDRKFNLEPGISRIKRAVTLLGIAVGTTIGLLVVVAVIAAAVSPTAQSSHASKHARASKPHASKPRANPCDRPASVACDRMLHSDTPTEQPVCKTAACDRVIERQSRIDLTREQGRIDSDSANALLAGIDPDTLSWMCDVRNDYTYRDFRDEYNSNGGATVTGVPTRAIWNALNSYCDN